MYTYLLMLIFVLVYAYKKSINTTHQIVNNCFSGWQRGVDNQRDLTLSTLRILYFYNEDRF